MVMMRLLAVLGIVCSCLNLANGAPKLPPHRECMVVEREMTRESPRLVREHRVVVLVDMKLIEVFLNWLIFYTRACPSSLGNLVVVCMDEASEKQMRKFGSISCSTEFSFQLGAADRTLSSTVNKGRREAQIWQKRIEVVMKLLEQGIDVLLSDADAIWLDGSRIMYELSRHQSPSNNWLIASRAWWPWEQFQQWGATACMGFAYFKSTPFSQSFFQKLHETLSDQKGMLPDDQVAVNRLLSQMNISWPGRLEVGANTASDRGTFVDQEGGERGVVLLPHNEFLRQCHTTHDNRSSIVVVDASAREQATQALRGALVAHCRVPKGEASKKARLIAYGLWRLCRQWRSRIRGGGSLRAYESARKLNQGGEGSARLSALIKVLLEDCDKIGQKEQKVGGK